MAEEVILHSETYGKVFEPIIHNLNITDGAARLYAHMHWRAGDSHKSKEGLESMAQMLGVGEVTISNRISELEAHDWIATVSRPKSDKTGNFNTHIYHVFERQEDCRKFRASFKSDNGDYLVAKPEITTRKLRKGAGGNPRISEIHARNRLKNQQPLASQLNSSLDSQLNSSLGDGLNSGLARRHNSSLDYLDSGVLDSFVPEIQELSPAVENPVVEIPVDNPQEPPTEETPVTPTPITAKSAPNAAAEQPTTPVAPPPSPVPDVPQSPAPEKPARQKNPLQEAVGYALNLRPGGHAGKVGKMLTHGDGLTGKWALTLDDGPMTPAEICAWGEWLRDKHGLDYEEFVPEKPETMVDSVNLFRADKECERWLREGEVRLGILLGTVLRVFEPLPGQFITLPEGYKTDDSTDLEEALDGMMERMTNHAAKNTPKEIAYFNAQKEVVAERRKAYAR